MSEAPGPQRGQQNGSQIEARRRSETKSSAANGSIRNTPMCRRTAVPLKKKRRSFFRLFKATRGAEWDYREEGGGEEEGRQSGLSVFFFQAQGFAI